MLGSTYKVQVATDSPILTDRDAPFYVAGVAKRDDGSVMVTLVINDSKRLKAFAYLEQHVPGFNWLREAASGVANTWGGKREGAGRPKAEGKGEQWNAGYQAGYKAGYRSFEERLGMSYRQIMQLVMNADIPEEQRAQILENIKKDKELKANG